MKFYDALKMLDQCENPEVAYIRRKEWKDDVQIRLMPDRVYSPHLAVFSRFGAIPWNPTQVEILLNDDWEFGTGTSRDELCKDITTVKKQIREMQKK